MNFLITIIAAIVTTIIWYANENRDTYKLGTLTLIYWGATLMWLMDLVTEFTKSRNEYFLYQTVGDVINDSYLGIAVVTLGLIAWLIILLIKDPKGVFKNRFLK